MNEIKDYILILENIISEKLCDSILNEYKDSNQWINTKIGKNIVNREIRNCTSIGISLNEIIEKNKNVRKKLMMMFLYAQKMPLKNIIKNLVRQI
jgi:hypothetical protein